MCSGLSLLSPSKRLIGTRCPHFQVDGERVIISQLSASSLSAIIRKSIDREHRGPLPSSSGGGSGVELAK